MKWEERKLWNESSQECYEEMAEEGYEEKILKMKMTNVKMKKMK